MGALRATLLTMAKMALSDGRVAVQEREFLQTMVDPADGPADQQVDALIEEARGKPLKELVAPVELYADRFFVALRAASMASIDAHLDAREEALYEELVDLLKLQKRDRDLIASTVASLASVEPAPPDPRIEQLFAESSFALGTSR